MTAPLDVLEHRIAELRSSIRTAAAAGDQPRTNELRAELRRTSRAWDALLGLDEPQQAYEPCGPRDALPAREHVHRVLTLLQVPAAPKLIVSVHEAFFPAELPPSKLSSLRRDEQRSYQAAPGLRPYYLCPALTHDRLAPARALITVSTWPAEQRILGPLSPRVNHLASAVRIAEALRTAEDTTPRTTNPAALQLLRRFAASIPGAADSAAADDQALDLQQIINAAQDELAKHADADRDTRAAASRHARAQFDAEQQLFGRPPH
ncbi:hypothetical protein [Amycolatopsis sp. NPDC004079]|uniref:hypothetical protein n=1 Tax=Amycolatopsis sp. NPDC004079 TaxID=3154549 RepID=UPI00339FC4AF